MQHKMCGPRDKKNNSSCVLKLGQPRSQGLSSSHKREWSKKEVSSTTPSCGKTNPGNEVETRAPYFHSKAGKRMMRHITIPDGELSTFDGLCCTSSTPIGLYFMGHNFAVSPRGATES